MTTDDLKNLQDAISGGYLDRTLTEEERDDLEDAIQGGYLAALLDVQPEDNLDDSAPRLKRGGFLSKIGKCLRKIGRKIDDRVLQPAKNRIIDGARKIGRKIDDRVLQPAKNRIIDGWINKGSKWLNGQLFEKSRPKL